MSRVPFLGVTTIGARHAPNMERTYFNTIVVCSRVTKPTFGLKFYYYSWVKFGLLVERPADSHLPTRHDLRRSARAPWLFPVSAPRPVDCHVCIFIRYLQLKSRYVHKNQVYLFRTVTQTTKTYNTTLTTGHQKYNRLFFTVTSDVYWNEANTVSLNFLSASLSHAKVKQCLLTHTKPLFIGLLVMWWATQKGRSNAQNGNDHLYLRWNCQLTNVDYNNEVIILLGY